MSIFQSLFGMFSAASSLINKGEKDSTFTVVDKGVNDTPLCIIENKDIFKRYANSVYGMGEERKYKPLSYYERYMKPGAKEMYEHRFLDKYRLRIGDSCFVIPPEFINVKETSNTVRVPGVRTTSTMKKKFGYSTTDITFDIYFNGTEQINGFKVSSPFDNVPYYIDGLRPLLAQCKLNPIMPVENEMLNKKCGIYCIGIQSITISTVPGFPKILKATVQATECNQSVYTEVPNFMYSNLIEWDLYRYNYQRLLTNIDAKNVHDSVKLKNVEKLDSNYNFTISILSDDTITKYKENESEFMDLTKAKYETYIDLKEDNLSIQTLQFGYSNILVNAQLSNQQKPAVQYLGGGDTGIYLQLITKDEETIIQFRNLISHTNYIIKKLKQASGIGFVKIDNEMLNMLGTQYMLIDSVDINTLPGFPDTYTIAMECVSYDIVNVMQEELDGFRPFTGNRKGTKDDCIGQTAEGVYNKINQDVYAEYRMCENSNLYPDLFLPTYEELDGAITKINSYREKLGYDKLPLSKSDYNPGVDFLFGSPYASTTVVEPDFYFAYGYSNMEKASFKVDDITNYVEPTNYVVNKTYESTISNGNSSNGSSGGSTSPTQFSGTVEEAMRSSSTISEAYCKVLLAQEGQDYKYGAVGELQSNGKRAWDCSGFCSWGIQQLGWKIERQINSSFIPNGICKSISKSEIQPGDLLVSSGHVACYIGNDQTIEAMGKAYGVCKGKVSSKYTQFGRIQWPKDVLDAFDKVKNTSNNGGGGATPNIKIIEETYNWNGSLSLTNKPAKIVLHHAEASSCTSQQIHQWHLGNGWTGIGYHFFVRKDGSIYRGRPENAIGSHTKDNNTNTLGICAEGSYMRETMPDAQKSAIKGLISYLDNKYGSLTVYGHKELGSSDCPGTNYPLAEMKAKAWKTTSKSSVDYSDYTLDGKVVGSGSSGKSKTTTTDYSDYTLDGKVVGTNNTNKTSTTSQTEIAIGKWGDYHDKHDEIIQKKCKEYNLSPNWMKALIRQECDMNEKAGPNSCNAVGLMQITKDPCSELKMEYNVDKLKTPDYNLTVGFKYMNWMRDKFGWTDYNDLISAHNCGPYGWKSTWKPNDRYKNNYEMRTHKEKVNKYYNELMANGGASGEYKNGVPGQDSSSPTTENGDTGSDTSSGTSVKQVSKNHGTKKVKYHGYMGIPYTDYSPINALLTSSGNPNTQDTATTLKGYKALPDSDLVGYQMYKYEPDRYKAMIDANTNVWKGINPNHTIDLKGTPKSDYKDMVNIFSDTNNNEYMSTSLVNDYQYNKRGSMLRAFPTFMVMINDDNEAWFDGRKLWSNYYPYRSVVSLSVHHEREQPVGTLKMSVTNLSKNLTRIPDGKFFKTIKDDKEYSSINRFLYKHYGFIIGTPKITDTMIESRNEINKELKLQPGARLHVRMGYGSNPFSLNTVFNGVIADVTVGEVVDIVAQSDGAELINSIISQDQEETNSTTNLQKEASNVIASLLIDRSSMFKSMFSGSRWGEASKYNIEHFGNTTGNFSALNREHEYDLCKNLYLGKYDKQLFCGTGRLDVSDGERDVEMFLYNKTPWDVMQTMTNTTPEFVCQPVYHQFESRLFYGLPTWLYKYRYDINESGAVLEQAKAFQQIHMINSSDIIDNKVQCTSKFSPTNVVAMYTLAGETKAGPTLFSDKSIDWSKQKTKVIDSIVQQDYIGWEPLWEFIGLDRAKENAIAIGISNLLYAWGTQYFDDLICLGKPGIKPIDQIFLDDQYAEMYGICTARSVTHTISPETGFVTTISPHMEAICSLGDSGTGNIYRSKIAYLDTVATISSSRENTIRDLEQLNSIAYEAITENHLLYSHLTQALDTMFSQNVDLEKRQEEIDKLFSNIKKEATLYETYDKMFKVLKTNYSIMGVCYVASTILKLPIISDVVDYFKYSHCIIARPLIYKNKPFISGVKGQTKLIEGMSYDPYFEDSEQ